METGRADGDAVGVISQPRRLESRNNLAAPGSFFLDSHVLRVERPPSGAITMNVRNCLVLLMAAVWLVPAPLPAPVSACCPAPPRGRPVVNADQTVIIIWDADSKTEHFIRQASFKSDADDFGFLVPTPTEPSLDESGNDAFPYLLKLTEPEKVKVSRPSGGGCACGGSAGVKGVRSDVRVLAEKLVAGFRAVVLEAESADALVRWLNEHGYAFSPEVEAWAKPYVEARWKITALRVAKDAKSNDQKTVAASALRMSFKTDRPLFPYREPDPTKQAALLGAKDRLLRIYFVGDARYRGELTEQVPWTGHVAWANELRPEDRKKLLGMLRLPETTGPAEWWLTEFEDPWPYQPAPADVYFARDGDQNPVKRPPVFEYTASALPTDVTAYAIGAVLLLPPVFRRLRPATTRGYWWPKR
jgi:hypothetical protein